MDMPHPLLRVGAVLAFVATMILYLGEGQMGGKPNVRYNASITPAGCASQSIFVQDHCAGTAGKRGGNPGARFHRVSFF